MTIKPDSDLPITDNDLLNIAYKVANAELLHNLSFTKSNQFTDHDCDDSFKFIFTLDPFWASYPAVQL